MSVPLRPCGLWRTVIRDLFRNHQIHPRRRPRTRSERDAFPTLVPESGRGFFGARGPSTVTPAVATATRSAAVQHAVSIFRSTRLGRPAPAGGGEPGGGQEKG